MNQPLIECVPNFSDGRDLSVIKQITDQIESANVRRMEALIKLAELRQTTLDALMDALELRPPAYV